MSFFLYPTRVRAWDGTTSVVKPKEGINKSPLTSPFTSPVASPTSAAAIAAMKSQNTFAAAIAAQNASLTVQTPLSPSQMLKSPTASSGSLLLSPSSGSSGSLLSPTSSTSTTTTTSSSGSTLTVPGANTLNPNTGSLSPRIKVHELEMKTATGAGMGSSASQTANALRRRSSIEIKQQMTAKRACVVPDCKQPRLARGYCAKHSRKYSGLSPAGINAREQPVPHDDISSRPLCTSEELRGVYDLYTSKSPESLFLTKAKWMTCIKESQLIDGKLMKEDDLNTVFETVAAVDNADVLDYPQFLEGLMQIALKKYPSKHKNALAYMMSHDLKLTVNMAAIEEMQDHESDTGHIGSPIREDEGEDQ